MKPNIVFIADNNHFRIWPGKSYYDLLMYSRANSKKFNIELFWTDQDVNMINEFINHTKPTLIVFFITGCIRLECKDFKFIFDSNIPTICAMLDMFFPNDAKEDYKIADSLVHIGKSSAVVNLYKSYFPEKFIGNFNSRFINVDKFKDYQLEKKYDILIYGSREFLHPFKKEELSSIQNFINGYEGKHNLKIEEETLLNFYYLRDRLEKLLVEKRNDKYKIKVLPMCGIYNAQISNEYLSMLINQSKITIACSTIADIMMHKYLEIGASKSVIMGNIPHDYKDLFENRMIGIDYFESDESILEKIDDALSNDEYLEQMSSQLYKEIHENHNFDCAVDNIDNVLAEICLFHDKKKDENSND
jgi:hypothetical protein